MDQLLQDLLTNAVWALLGAVVVALARLFQSILPARSLWRLGNPKDITVITAASTATHTGEYIRPATGIGQIHALGVAAQSLNRAYGRLELRHIYLSTRPLSRLLENDLLLLGGPKNNGISRDFLELLQDKQPVVQNGSIIHWRKQGPDGWVQTDDLAFSGKAVDEKIVTDYGVIIRTQNPFAPAHNPRSAILLSGCHTYGVIAAARYFANGMYQDFGWRKLRAHNVVALVSARVVDGYPVNIKLEKQFLW